MKAIFAGLFLFVFYQCALAQPFIIKGKITDSENGDPIPFANVVVKGTTIGTVCDFDGNYTLRLPKMVDSVSAS